MTKKIAILGASGYTGAELVRLIATHPDMEIAALAAERKAGLKMADVFPHLRHLDLPDLVRIDEIDFAGIDLCFCALPHKTSQEVIRDLPRDLKIVDLSADFRLRDPAAYEKWYGNAHAAVEMQGEAVYGLTEFYRNDIRAARLVASWLENDRKRIAALMDPLLMMIVGSFVLVVVLAILLPIFDLQAMVAAPG